jgi:hypothetical protein
MKASKMKIIFSEVLWEDKGKIRKLNSIKNLKKIFF